MSALPAWPYGRAGNGDSLHPIREWLVAVGLGPDGRVGFFSHYCGGAAAWCIAAPGEVVTTHRNGSWTVTSGTPFTAPYVAAALAALKSMYPHLTYHQIRACFLATADTSLPYDVPDRILCATLFAQPLQDRHSAIASRIVMLAMTMPHRYNAPYMDACNAQSSVAITGPGGATVADHHHRAGALPYASHFAYALRQRRIDGRSAEQPGDCCRRRRHVRNIPPHRQARSLAGSPGVGLPPHPRDSYSLRVRTADPIVSPEKLPVRRPVV